jgi:hypothetical protein
MPPKRRKPGVAPAFERQSMIATARIRATLTFLLLVRARLANYRLEPFFPPLAAAFDFTLPF